MAETRDPRPAGAARPSTDGALPEPLTPPGCNVRSLKSLMIDCDRLLNSWIWHHASPEGLRAALSLWFRCFHDTPAASLPDDDVMLASFAGYGRDVAAWRRIREEALHGFVKCADGRLYHPVVAEKVLAAIGSSEQKRRAGRASGRARKAARRLQEQGDSARTDARRRSGARSTDAGQSNPIESDERETEGSGLSAAGTARGDPPSVGDPPPVGDPPWVGDPTPALRPIDGGRRYAFRGAVVRLTEADFAQWTASYAAIPDLRGELQAIDDQARDWPAEERRRWYPRVSAWLRSKNERLSRQARAEAHPRRPDGLPFHAIPRY